MNEEAPNDGIDTRSLRMRITDAVMDVLWFLPPFRHIWALSTGSVCSLIPGRVGRNCLGAACLEHHYRGPGQG